MEKVSIIITIVSIAAIVASTIAWRSAKYYSNFMALPWRYKLEQHNYDKRKLAIIRKLAHSWNTCAVAELFSHKFLDVLHIRDIKMYDTVMLYGRKFGNVSRRLEESPTKFEIYNCISKMKILLEKLENLRDEADLVYGINDKIEQQI
jgi:hypothetical protein